MLYDYKTLYILEYLDIFYVFSIFELEYDFLHFRREKLNTNFPSFARNIGKWDFLKSFSYTVMISENATNFHRFLPLCPFAL